jgi:hypothetical protein
LHNFSRLPKVPRNLVAASLLIENCCCDARRLAAVHSLGGSVDEQTAVPGLPELHDRLQAQQGLSRKVPQLRRTLDPGPCSSAQPLSGCAFRIARDGRRLKILPIVDEHTRESHAILVQRSITAEDVVSLLGYLFSVHGEPEFIRSDNGPEFIAKTADWMLASVKGWRSYSYV